MSIFGGGGHRDRGHDHTDRFKDMTRHSGHGKPAEGRHSNRSVHSRNDARNARSGSRRDNRGRGR